MHKKFLSALLLAGFAVLPSARGEEVSSADLLDAVKGAFGDHPGQRKTHPKGFCAVGEFVPAKEAKTFSSSALFTTKKSPVVARFSIAGGNPAAPDGARSPRGFAVQFKVSPSELVNTATLNVPVYSAKDPETFLGLLRALAIDPATGKVDGAKVNAFREAHPDTLVQAAWLRSNPPPWSYATARYYSINTFYFVNKAGKQQAVRWEWVPEDGLRVLSEEELASAPPSFLQARLLERFQQGPVSWRLEAQFAEAGDRLDDATVTWPAERKRVILGKVSLREAGTDRTGPCDAISFDPTVLGKRGIKPGNDPIFRARSPAYALSYGRRLSGQ